MGCIEDTKIFGKKSKRWHQKIRQMQIDRQNNKSVSVSQQNSKNNPIHIVSTSISPQKLIKQRQVSTEPLMNAAVAKQQQMDRLHQHQHVQSLYYSQAQRRPYPMYPTHPMSYFRGYPSMPTANGRYYAGFNREARSELLGDAEKLKMKQLEEKKRLDDHKQFLQNDLDSHLVPTSTSKTSAKHKLLFESLKGPKTNGLSKSNGQKKTAQPPLRVHKDLIDSISSLPIMHSKYSQNHSHNDTDSTMSTITVKSTDNESINACKDDDESVIVLDSDDSTLPGKKRKQTKHIKALSTPNKRI